jgi:rubrerythrin
MKLVFFTKLEYRKNYINNREVGNMSSKENLMDAFTGESQANRKYLAFAKKADEEGFKQFAKLFRAAAEAKTVHAHNHLEIADEIDETKENLFAAIRGETEEFTDMYPNFIAEAKAEKNDSALWTFSVANKVEQIHAVLY